MRACRVILWGLVVGLGLMAGSCSGCEELDDQALIIQLIDRGARSAEKHRVGDLMSLTTDDFLLEPQQMDRRSAKGVVFMVLRRYGKLKVHYPRPSVDVAASRAEAEASFPFVIVREGSKVPNLSQLYDDPEGWLGQVARKADLYYMNLWLVKEDDVWLVNKAKVDGYRNPMDI